MCHVSRVTCHLSHVTCQVSNKKKITNLKKWNFQNKIGKSGGAFRWRVCYQRGLPRLVSDDFHVNLQGRLSLIKGISYIRQEDFGMSVLCHVSVTLSPSPCILKWAGLGSFWNVTQGLEI